MDKVTITRWTFFGFGVALCMYLIMYFIGVEQKPFWPTVMVVTCAWMYMSVILNRIFPEKNRPFNNRPAI